MNKRLLAWGLALLLVVLLCPLSLADYPVEEIDIPDDLASRISGVEVVFADGKRVMVTVSEKALETMTLKDLYASAYLSYLDGYDNSQILENMFADPAE